MPSDLEMSLVDGGLAPALAKVIAGAIDNAATPKYARGRAFSDATPATELRMVSADYRRNVLTNLDHPGRKSSDKYGPKSGDHPYKGSQPATSSGTISTPAVVAGDFLSVDTAPKDSVAQATISLNVRSYGGSHVRLDGATNTVQAVPFSVRVAQEQFMEARFEERPDGTVLFIALKNLKSFTLPDGSQVIGWAT